MTAGRSLELAAISARHQGPHSCFGMTPVGDGYRVFGHPADGVECDAAVLVAEVERLREALEPLRPLSEAASPGPWTLGEMGPPVQVTGTKYRPTAPQVWHSGYGAPVATLDGRPGAPEKDETDAAFIVAAVNYARAALASEPQP